MTALMVGTALHRRRHHNWNNTPCVLPGAISSASLLALATALFQPGVIFGGSPIVVAQAVRLLRDLSASPAAATVRSQ